MSLLGFRKLKNLNNIFSMLKIENLHASIDDKSILKGLNLEVKA